ncbi:hypothetical protein T492DRAFT_964961, partial [Pavlovales sp. CCMP2436]
MLLPAAAAVCALVASRCCPLEVLAGTSRPPVSLGSSSGCASRAAEDAAARGGGLHAETPLKATKATTMLLPAAAAVCALAASRCCPLEVLAGTSRPPVSLRSSSKWHCCTRRRAARGDAAQGYQGYEDDAAPCGRHGRDAAAEARPRRGVGAGAHTFTPSGNLGRSLDLSLTSTKPVTEQQLSIGTRGGAQASAADKGTQQAMGDAALRPAQHSE